MDSLQFRAGDRVYIPAACAHGVVIGAEAGSSAFRVRTDFGCALVVPAEAMLCSAAAIAPEVEPPLGRGAAWRRTPAPDHLCREA